MKSEQPDVDVGAEFPQPAGGFQRTHVEAFAKHQEQASFALSEMLLSEVAKIAVAGERIGGGHRVTASVSDKGRLLFLGTVLLPSDKVFELLLTPAAVSEGEAEVHAQQPIQVEDDVALVLVPVVEPGHKQVMRDERREHVPQP